MKRIVFTCEAIAVFPFIVLLAFMLAILDRDFSWVADSVRDMFEMIARGE